MTLKLPIYMDNHSTTPVDPRVVAAMLPYFTESFGNASSRSHSFGWRAEEAVERAREQVAALIGASPKEIVFTSGATESDNLAIKGVAERCADKGRHLVTCAIEHKAVLDSCKRLERQGFTTTVLPVGTDGRVSPEALREAITPQTLLVSIMLANNEVGSVQPVNEIGRICREKGVLFHTDAVQGVGKVPFDVEAANADLVSLTAHKMYGPKGVGALYVRRKPKVQLAALVDGGGQEKGLRPGTLAVPSIVGFGRAAELAKAEMVEESARLLRLRERLRQGLFEKLERVELNGALEHRLPGNLNVAFAYVEAEALMMAMKDVAVSSGSACTSASLEPSYVLRACGVSDPMAHGSIRFGLGRFNSEEEVDYVIDLVVQKVQKLRAASPLYQMARETEMRRTAR